MSESGANITPDKLSAPELAPVTKACHHHLKRASPRSILSCSWASADWPRLAFVKSRRTAALPASGAKITEDFAGGLKDRRVNFVHWIFVHMGEDPALLTR